MPLQPCSCHGRAVHYNEGVIAGAPGAVQDFLRIARGREWR